MDQLLIILIALAAASLCWGLARAVGGTSEGRRRKLKQRLGVMAGGSSGRGRAGAGALLLQDRASGLPSFLDDLFIVEFLQDFVARGYPGLSVARFLLVVMLTAALPFGLGWLASDSLAMAAVLGAGGAYLPFFIGTARCHRIRRRLTEQLPEALDFLTRVLRSGQSLSTGFQMIAEELADPLAGEFRRCYDQHGLGQSIEDGLREMAIRLESPDVSFFATAVIIQKTSGGDLAEVLKNISNMVRQRLRLQQSVKAKTAEGRFTGYVMVAFPAVMFCLAYFLNPDYGRLLLHTGQGHVLLGTAFGLQMLGLFVIRRITNVKV